MIRKYDFDNEAILECIDTGALPERYLSSSGSVAVIMTQGWCPQWTAMDRALSNPDSDKDMDVYIAVYDRFKEFDRFRDFKEKQFGNDLIPYVRYYKDGRFLGDSNYVSPWTFYDNLEQTVP